MATTNSTAAPKAVAQNAKAQLQQQMNSLYGGSAAWLTTALENDNSPTAQAFQQDMDQIYSWNPTSAPLTLGDVEEKYADFLDQHVVNSGLANPDLLAQTHQYMQQYFQQAPPYQIESTREELEEGAFETVELTLDGFLRLDSAEKNWGKLSSLGHRIVRYEQDSSSTKLSCFLGTVGLRGHNNSRDIRANMLALINIPLEVNDIEIEVSYRFNGESEIDRSFTKTDHCHTALQLNMHLDCTPYVADAPVMSTEPWDSFLYYHFGKVPLVKRLGDNQLITKSIPMSLNSNRSNTWLQLGFHTQVVHGLYGPYGEVRTRFELTVEQVRVRYQLPR